MNTSPTSGLTKLLFKEKHSPAPSSLRAILAENYRQIGGCFFVTLALTLVMAGLMPAFSLYWNFTIGKLLDWLNLEVTLNHVHGLLPSLETSVPLAAGDYLPHIGISLGLMLLARLFLRAPFRSLIIGVGGLHLLNTLLGLAFPSVFPYSLGEHTGALSIFTTGLILALPFFMLITHAIIERSLERRIFATLLLCVYFILSLPVKLVAHTALILSLGKLAMPSLFLLLGPVLDILLLTTLYAFVVTWRHNAPTS